MPNWTESMQQTFEYYTVDPGTWKDDKLLRNIKSSDISRDSTVETLGSASIDITESVGECYIRKYLVTVQNGVTEKHPLDVFLVQTPSSTFDGKIRNVTMDAYTPLIELKEKQPPIGYFVAKGENIMQVAYRLARENVRAPVVEAKCETTLSYDFVADPNDTWLSFLTDLIKNAKYTFGLDDMGRILFSPIQDTASLQPVWTYDDDNSSILLPELTINHDLYDVPNVVEVVYSNGTDTFRSTVTNDDPNSPISTVNRGRVIKRRITDPSIIGNATQEQVDEYAERLLRELSTLEYTASYEHGFCPVRIGDCVRLNYTRSGWSDIKAKVISQNIKCKPGCQVSEKAVFTVKLWG
jgi:hypothetical protein